MSMANDDTAQLSSVSVTILNSLTGAVILDQEKIPSPLTVAKVKSHLPCGKLLQNESVVELREGIHDELIQSLCESAGESSLKLSFVLQPERIKQQHTYVSGVEYDGEMKSDGTLTRDGHGVQKWTDGASYEGQWVNNKAHGNGKFRHVDGDVYDGEWENDKAHGVGTYSHVDGSVYTGQWKEDKQNGFGREEWPDHAVYEGEYLNGFKAGDGSFSWSDGSSYVGKFLNNDIHGKGTYIWSDGRRFEGQWKKNRMDGFGKFSWLDGRTYEGQYMDDRKDGRGFFSWPDGRKYDGQWVAGQQHGYGTYHKKRGDARKGYWEEGNRTRWLEEGEEMPFKSAVIVEFLNADGETQTMEFTRSPFGMSFLSKTPITIATVVAGSMAEELGVQSGWIVSRIGGTSLEGMTYKDAKLTIDKKIKELQVSDMNGESDTHHEEDTETGRLHRRRSSRSMETKESHIARDCSGCGMRGDLQLTIVMGIALGIAMANFFVKRQHRQAIV